MIPNNYIQDLKNYTKLVHYKFILLFAGILGGLAFVTFFYKALGVMQAAAMIACSIVGALISVCLQHLMIILYTDKNNKNSIHRYMRISVSSFAEYFLFVIILSTFSNYDLTLQYLAWGLAVTFCLSLVLLRSILTRNQIRKSSLRKAVSVFITLTLIAFTFPTSLHVYLWNKSPCSNGQCKIESHEGH